MASDGALPCHGDSNFALLEGSQIVLQGDDNLPPRIVEYINDVLGENLKAKLCSEERLVEIESEDATLALRYLYANRALYRYTHRYFIVQESLGELTIEAVKSLALKHNIDLKASKIRLNMFPKAVTEQVVDMCWDHMTLSPTDYSYLLSVVRYIVPSNDKKAKNYTWKIGFSPSSATLDHHAAFERLEDEEKISRAYYKIQEACDRCGIKEWPQPTWNALDIGASPGGWSLYLSQVVGKVFAVDPADLVINRPNVVHLKGKIQQVIPQIDGVPLHMIVCDMNEDASIAIGCIASVIDRLQVGGRIILTFKYQKRAQSNIEGRLIADCKAFLTAMPCCDVFKTMHLVSNHHERTLIAIKSRPSAEPKPQDTPSSSQLGT